MKWQDNAWVTKDIFKYWLNNIWYKYDIKNNKKLILILDRATSHYFTELKDEFYSRNYKYVLIPPALTRFAQPLDISVNFPFKSEMKRNYFQYNFSNGNNKKANQNNIVNFVYDCWYNENTIKANVIKNSFRFAGITEDFELSSSKIKFRWPIEIVPKVNMKEYIEEYINARRNIRNEEIIEDNYEDVDKAEYALEPKIDEIFKKIN